MIDAYQMEGDAGSQFVQMIRALGHNKDVDVELGTVVAAAPSIRVRLDGMSIDLEADDLVVAAHLTKHKRRIRINDGAEQVYEFMDELAVGDRVIVLTADEGQSYYVIDRAVTY